MITQNRKKAPRLTLIAVSVLCLASAAGATPPTPDLSTRAVFELVSETPAAFAQSWNRRCAQARSRDRLERAAFRAQCARGFIDYAYFHWRETGESVPDRWRPLDRAVARVERNNAALLERQEQREFLDSWLRYEARQLLATNPELQTGDNRWLRARFQVVEASIANTDVRRFLLSTALAQHIDENDARGVPQLIDRFAALTEAPESEVERLRTAAQEDLALRDGHRIETYKTVDGVALELHIQSTTGSDANARPALLWFHGGSWATGSWAQCPVFCRIAREQGYVTIQVDFRTADRFNALPADAIVDARDALAFVRAHADELGVDRNRIVVAGFSSGGSIASFLATSSPPQAVAGALLVSACTVPLHDAWFFRSVIGDPADPRWTPAASLDRSDPALLLLHGTSDEMCEYADTEGFAAAASSAHVDAKLVTLEGASHFFVFNNPPARNRASEEAAAFLARWR